MEFSENVIAIKNEDNKIDVYFDSTQWQVKIPELGDRDIFPPQLKEKNIGVISSDLLASPLKDFKDAFNYAKIHLLPFDKQIWFTEQVSINIGKKR